MRDYDNVECLRCGNQWYSAKFDEEGKVPDHCPQCYRSEVREIPDPPTKIDLLAEDLEKKRRQLPEKIAQKKHDMVIWREQHRFMISMLKTGLVMMLLVAGLVYALFFM